MAPLVSIIIPFYNDPYVDQAVVSALYQTYPNIEVIVVDDGSTCNQERLNPYRSRINYLGKANGGTASALNHGMRMANGKYVTWLSSDDRFYPDKVAKQVDYMERHNAQISHTDYDVMNEHGTIVQRMAAVKFATAKSFIAAMLHGNPVNGCTVMMTKHLIQSIGWFNEHLPYTHDYELWIRVLLSRVDFHYINEPLTVYRRHSQMGTVRHFDHVLQEVQAVTNIYGGRIMSLLSQLPG
jgi:glycosyltransferase involved in cell wall biosynthesis